jgi:hypothetical protein
VSCLSFGDNSAGTYSEEGAIAEDGHDMDSFRGIAVTAYEWYEMRRPIHHAANTLASLINSLGIEREEVSMMGMEGYAFFLSVRAKTLRWVKKEEEMITVMSMLLRGA